MTWKELPTWLKGGIIGLGVAVIFIFISLFGAAATCVVGGTHPPICNIFRRTAVSPLYILFPIIGIIIGLINSKSKPGKKK
jgi:uncharacterized membrane protein